MVSKGQFSGLDWNCIFSSCFEFRFFYEWWNAVLKSDEVIRFSNAANNCSRITMKKYEELIKK